MSATPSTMLELGTRAPDFNLPNCNPEVGGERVGLDDFGKVPALLVAFICNHCPFVVHVRDELCQLARDYRQQGFAMVALSANDADGYPEDAPAAMTKDAQRYRFPFPYLYDETQEVAKAYRASCTPDFFLFDAAAELVYRGRLDGSSPGNDIPVSGADMRAAIEAVLAGRAPPSVQKPSMGCNIKWKPGNVPDYHS